LPGSFAVASLLTLVALLTLLARVGVDRAEAARIKSAAEGNNELRS
jgi:ABC-type sulfate transport system permease subunit